MESALTKIANQGYLVAWLSQSNSDYSWFINFFNYIDDDNSKEIQSYPIIKDATCLDIFYDPAYSFYPSNAAFLVFCTT